MTVAAWLEDWSTKSLAASDRKQATKDLYATLARTHLVPTVGTIPWPGCAPPTWKRSLSLSGMPACRRPRFGRSTRSFEGPWTSPYGTGCSAAIPLRR